MMKMPAIGETGYNSANFSSQDSQCNVGKALRNWLICTIQCADLVIFLTAPDVSALDHDTAALGSAILAKLKPIPNCVFLYSAAVYISDKTSYYISYGTVCYGVWLNWCGCPMQLYKKKKKKIWVLWLILIPYVLLRYAMRCHAMPCHAMPCHVGYVATVQT
uniref:Uncharacterized protein n=1 Tax=Glossina austeni TaxID=7395 RepID=A0A1A9VCW2_GLOAU